MTTQELIQIAVANQSANIAIITAVIAICGVIISGVVSLFVAKWTAKNEQNKIHQENSKLLLQKRMEIYPELWESVSKIFGSRIMKNKNKNPEKIIKRNKDECLHLIRIWRNKNGMFLSEKSLRIFYKLEDSLYLNPKFKMYNDEKINNIEKYKKSFLKSLKEDIGILEDSSIFLKKELQIMK